MTKLSAQPRSTLKFVGFFFGAHKGRTLSAIIFLGLAGLLEGVGVMTLVPVLQLADRASGKVEGPSRYIAQALQAVGLTTTLPALLAVLFIAILAKSGVLRLAMAQVRLTHIQVIRELRLRLVRSLLRAGWRHLVAERTGAWANAMATESTHAGGAYREACEIMAALFPVTMYLILSMLISWRITIFSLICGAVVLLLLKGFVKISRRAGTDQVRVAKTLSAATVDILQSLKPAKAMARERLIEPIFGKSIDELDDATRRAMYAAENLRFFQEPALTLLLAASIYLLFELGDFPLPTVMVLAFMFYRILQHLNTLQSRFQILVVGEASFWSLLDRIEKAEAACEVLHDGSPPGRLREGVELRHVCFSYDDRSVLQDINLKLRAGRLAAIEGESGCGKTTLADLIAGLYEPTGGQILVDGRDLSTLDLRAWRSELGYVPQEMLLLNDNIRRNVTLGDPSLTDADVERALRLAGAWDFVSRIPEGLDAEVGERGARLSGGQRQRIAIARALVTRPTLLILDEVTASLDPATEAAICETLVRLRGEVTILAISHQPALRNAADEAYRMRAGRLEPVRTTNAIQEDECSAG
ncbi:MAG TPA: ABC transporter ATP-binding protein [Steroidobacter sp.]|nr:ABC transporter ATP-binding protein [Steroidobacter sp.]